MFLISKKRIFGIAFISMLTFSPIASFAIEPEAQQVPVYVNQVLKPYTLIKKISAEVYVVDAKSEEDAELKAYRKLQATAAAHNADGLIEVKRYILKDNVALRSTSTVTASMFKDDLDSTAESLDELTLDSYARGKGTLSTKPIDQTFDRSKLSGKVIRFTGKAIKLD